ncbi:uncharacterized protein LOC109725346 [Ananas comosus]|uniref:Uncharacterized protein LOC109725346 n=1 Tax=Ananas comosus TaxID=4615 RepID=A0A6P5GQL7_ANACO|nr:uncharacterized protein LOC109725346 [Ananas comosus]
MFNTTSTLMRFGSNFPPNHSLFSSSQGRKYSSPFTTRKRLLVYPCSWNQVQLKAFASRKSERKRSGDRKTTKEGTLTSKILSPDGYKESTDKDSNDGNSGRSASVELLNENADAAVQVAGSSRAAVLQACIITSVLLVASGVAIRQASHLAYAKGWANFDSTEIAFGFEMWHIELIVGLVILISTSRFILLKIWPDFSESSDAANQQILSSLQPLDYVVVAFLPGISEELLFRGGLMPLFGLNWISALGIGALFGVLHLGGGRKLSYAVWATFVGFAYGVATVTSASLVVPMASHSLNNLVGGLLWRFAASNPQEKQM